MQRLRRSRVLRALQAAWVILVLAFLGLYVWKNWSRFADFSRDISLGWMALAAVLILLRRLTGALRWTALALSGPDSPNALRPRSRRIRAQLAVYFLSGLAIYIPGNVWFIANRIVLARQKGVSVAGAAVGMGYETALAVWTAILVGAVAALHVFVSDRAITYGLVAVFFAVSLFLFHRGLLVRGVNRLLALVRRPPHTALVPMPTLLVLCGVSVVIWMIAGASLACIVKALAPAAEPGLVYLASAAAFSWVAGFVVPWAPSGLGIQDGLLVFFLQDLAAPVPVLAAVCLRLLHVFADLFWGGVSWLFFKGSSRQKP